MHQCTKCGDDVRPQRWALGFKLCLSCGETHAQQRRHTVVPLNKSNYIMVTDLAMLSQLNPKRTT